MFVSSTKSPSTVLPLLPPISSRKLAVSRISQHKVWPIFSSVGGLPDTIRTVSGSRLLSKGPDLMDSADVLVVVLLGEGAEFGTHVHRLINVVVSRVQVLQVALLLAGAHVAHQHEELA